MDYIGIKQVGKDAEWNRGSCFEVSPLYLTVIGNLPHNYKFTPKNPIEAMHLIAWLKDWIEYEKG